MKRRATALVGLGLGLVALSACGSSSSGGAAATTAAAGTTAAATATTASAATTAATATTKAPVATTAGAATTAATATTAAGATTAGSSTAVDVKLVEWGITAPAKLTAGSVTFNVTNAGSFPHELVVIKGAGYKSLPLASDGSVQLDQLPAGANLGQADHLGPGSSKTLTVTLAPGHYVLVCNIRGGGSSHAAKGQVAEVDVA